MTVILALCLAFADLAAVKSEPNPEKRSDLAIKNAAQALEDARTAYQAGDIKKTDGDLIEVRDSINLALDSLESSGKQPRKSKYYKKAELRLSQLLRRISGFRDEMSVEDRKPLDDVAARAQEVHDRLLSEIMSKGKPKR